MSQLKELSLKYLSRYSTSSINLQKYLMKKAKYFYKTELQQNEPLIKDIEQCIDETLLYLTSLGYLNDNLYTKYKTKSMLNKGKSINTIKQSLKEKGLSRENIDQFITKDNSYNINLYSAIKTIKRKKFGSFRASVIKDEIPNYEEDINLLDNKNIAKKEITSMLRYGFPYDIIKLVLSLSKEDIEDTYYNLKNEIDI